MDMVVGSRGKSTSWAGPGDAAAGRKGKSSRTHVVVTGKRGNSGGLRRCQAAARRRDNPQR